MDRNDRVVHSFVVETNSKTVLWVEAVPEMQHDDRTSRSGCNHMTCRGLADTSFCYQCLREWNTQSDQCGSGACQLWEEDRVIEPGEARVQQVEATLGRELLCGRSDSAPRWRDCEPMRCVISSGGASGITKGNVPTAPLKCTPTACIAVPTVATLSITSAHVIASGVVDGGRQLPWRFEKLRESTRASLSIVEFGDSYGVGSTVDGCQED